MACLHTLVIVMAIHMTTHLLMHAIVITHTMLLCSPLLVVLTVGVLTMRIVNSHIR
jgi:hypothetical protein